MESIIASLWSSFRRVPPSAIPAILDCILSCTTASPSSLFSDLLNEFPILTKGIAQRSKVMDFEWQECAGSYVAALCHFLKKLGANHMEIFILKMWIPLLGLVHVNDSGLFNEVACLFLDVVTETNSWEVLEATLVPLLFRSIGLSMGMSQSEEHSIYKWNAKSSFNVSYDGEASSTYCDDFHKRLFEKGTYEDFVLSQSFDFPLSMSCNILSLTLNAALPNKHKGVVVSYSSLATGSSVIFFAGKILWDLSNLTLQMLSQSMEHRSSAIKFLLPLLLKAFACTHTFEVSVCGTNHVLTRKHFFMELWKCCKILFSLGSLERRDAYDVLSLYLSFSSSCDEHNGVNVYEREDMFALRADKKFWDEIRRGLLDKNGFVRKQSLDILKTTLSLNKEREVHNGFLVLDDKSSASYSMSKRQRWADSEAKSLGIGRIYNDTDSNFTGWQRWVAFVFQYEMLEEYGIHLVEAVWNHQTIRWLQSLSPMNNTSNSVNGELHGYQMASSEQIFEWLTILWERGFCHDNPQVRCLIMQSFLAIEWKNYGSSAKLVPTDFVLGALIRGLNDPVQHKDFGVKEVYSSWAIEAVALFLWHYVGDMNGRQHISFLVHLASVPKSYSFGRAGLMCLANCIASASCGSLKYNNHEVERSNDASSIEVLAESEANDRADLLDGLRFILECSKQHFNPTYRCKVCEKILASASAVMNAVDVPFETLLLFISSLPREYTDNGGSLRHGVQKWLRSPNLQLFKAIGGFSRNFISHKNPQPLDSSIACDDEELAAWVSQAKRWARVLFLVVEDEKHLDPILKFIQDYGGDICKQNYFEWVEVKFLILLSSLVEELHLMQKRTSDYHVTTGMNCDLDIYGKMNNLYIMKGSIFVEKFVMIFLSILEELTSFTKSSCSIFWMTVEMENETLPGSIRGRLGGQSQRRLSRSLCASVLRAITSVKTLVSILRLCAQFKTDILLDSTHAFLWSLCWKIITPPAYKSEVDAEVCTAAYEACSYAMKDLVSMFSPISMDLVLKNSISSLSEADGEAVLDAFISTFIHNINNVIDGGNLARTRRAILMNWKWSCLESLLSIPNHALCNGVCKKSWGFYFSDTVVGQIFRDLVGSLENAGEVSVLPLLRSVRLSMEFFALRTTDSVSTSCEGITIKMMWLLVHSAWILHVSCNKRRVAPIAALLSSVLHYSVFGDEDMHKFDGASGPLKWFVEKVLEEGTKSPRTIRLVALHLAGLWLAYPNILKYYMEELKLLALYGSVAFDEDFESELAENYDARIEVLVLSRSLDPDLTDRFINTELYARVSVAVLFSKLADMADLVKTTVVTKDSLDAVASGKTFLLELLDFVVNDKDIAKELYKKYSAIHRRKIRAWQMICVLSRFVELDIVEQVMSRLHTSINKNNLPSVRQYLETTAIHVYLKFPLLVGQHLVPLLRNYDLRPQALSSYVFIAANIILHANKETQFGHLDELLPPIIPLLTSHHHTLRGFTQILVYQVLQILLPKSSSSASAEMFLEKKCFIDLRSYLSNNSDCARLRASMDSYLDAFDPTKSVSPRGIFTNRVEEVEFECVPTALMERVIDFLNETREDLRCSMAKDAVAIKNASLLIDDDIESNEVLNSNRGPSIIQKPEDLTVDFQKKNYIFKTRAATTGVYSF